MAAMKIAIITGITGQDGSYLADFLLAKGYTVHGVIRRSASINTWRIHHLFENPEIYNQRLFLHYGDITDAICVSRLVDSVAPDEFYNLAAQSHVKVSFEIPEITANIDALGTLKILEIMRQQQRPIKFYQASTSELFGSVQQTPQDENTPFYPRSPYGVAKQYAFWIVKNYREAYNLFACNGILFNHESERRGFNFVSRKITVGLAKIKLGQQSVLELGNLYAKRDWGYAPEYVESMWRMLQQSEADDYVVATGETHSIKEFVETSCAELSINLRWQGEGLSEVGIDTDSNKTIIRVNERYFRPTEVDILLGNPDKAKSQLNWRAKTKFRDLVKIMVQSDLELVRSGSRILY